MRGAVDGTWRTIPLAVERTPNEAALLKTQCAEWWTVAQRARRLGIDTILCGRASSCGHIHNKSASNMDNYSKGLAVGVGSFAVSYASADCCSTVFDPSIAAKSITVANAAMATSHRNAMKPMPWEPKEL